MRSRGTVKARLLLIKGDIQLLWKSKTAASLRSIINHQESVWEERASIATRHWDRSHAWSGRVDAQCSPRRWPNFGTIRTFM